MEERAAISLDGGSIAARLEAHGFIRVSTSTGGRHALMRRGHLDVVIPGPDRAVPERVASMIERSLEPVLGAEWLGTEPRGTEAEPSDGVAVLDVFVLEPTHDDPWRAFLADEPGTVGYADDRTSALSDLKSAAALRLGLPEDQVVLVTPDVL